MQVHFQTLGCRLNEAELESWARQFRQRGHTVAADIEHADLVVVNTCAVTEEAVRKSRRLIRRAQRSNPHARLVVSGCYASLNPDESSRLPGVDLLVDNRDKEDLPNLVSQAFSVPGMPLIATEPGENPLFRRGRQRAFIKVQDGCRYRCTFCIVTEARGEERSKPLKEIIGEINDLSAQGVQEVVITGVHLGGYGSELGLDLSELISAILEQTSIPRLRLGSLEPWDIPDGFWRLFNNNRLMPHLHLPLQSGADTVLRRMARRCKTTDFQQLLTDAQQRVPDLNITTDIIVGFPGESDAEWRQTMDFLRQLSFSHMHIFSYSPRPGTKAAGLPAQIDDNTKRQRSRELHQLMSEMKNASLKAAINQSVEVLVESKTSDDSGDCYVGYTPNYLRIRFPVPEEESSMENCIVTVRITAVDHENGRLRGHIAC